MTDTDTTDTTATPHGPVLTRDHIVAMRTGDSYVVTLENGKATLRVSRRLPAPPGFTPNYSWNGPEAETTFDVAADSIVNACFVMLYGYANMRALAFIVKPGDVLRFGARVNNSGYIDAASIAPGAMDDRYHAGGYSKLYAEELTVTILRPNASTGRAATIVRDMLLAYSVVPDNSARNIRRTERA